MFCLRGRQAKPIPRLSVASIENRNVKKTGGPSTAPIPESPDKGLAANPAFGRNAIDGSKWVLIALAEEGSPYGIDGLPYLMGGEIGCSTKTFRLLRAGIVPNRVGLSPAPWQRHPRQSLLKRRRPPLPRKTREIARRPLRH
ncbi:protein of unknown function [Magnetospira sp. QH-2]|nr:protein of unknown function [Magnetospira sp. QH-2]